MKKGLLGILASSILVCPSIGCNTTQKYELKKLYESKGYMGNVGTLKEFSHYELVPATQHSVNIIQLEPEESKKMNEILYYDRPLK